MRAYRIFMKTYKWCVFKLNIVLANFKIEHLTEVIQNIPEKLRTFYNKLAKMKVEIESIRGRK